MEVFPRIPGFSIDKKLGKNRFADVYLGVVEAEGPGKNVVIKLLYPELFLGSKFEEKFLKEIQKGNKFVHPNVAEVIETGQCDDGLYVVMEYLPGGLRDKINRRFKNDGHEPPADAGDEAGETEKTGKLGSCAPLHILEQIARALDYARKEGVVHGDIRPDNIRFREDGAAVLDFFIFNMAAFRDFLKKKSIISRVPHYASPEQTLGKTLGHSSDVYSLGVVFYEMLTGKVPYDAEETIAIENQHIMEPVPQLPENLAPYQSLLERMMAKTTEERPGAGDELVRLIDDLGCKLLDNKRKTPIEPGAPRDSKSAEKKKKKGIGKEDILKILLNPGVLAPVIGVVLVIVILLFLFIKPSSPPPGDTMAAAAKKTAVEKEKKKEKETKTKLLTEKEKRMQEAKEARFQFKLKLAQRFFKDNEYRKAMDKLIEAEKVKKTAESRRLAGVLTVKLAEIKDDDTFKQAFAAGTISPLEDYVKQYPAGRHLKEAEEKLNRLKTEKAKQEARRRRILAASVKLRSQYKDLTTREVRTMLKNRGFFDKYYNKSIDFKNHFQVKTVKEDKIVLDFATALVWHQSGSRDYKNLKKAVEWLEELNANGYAGYSDWRLPTLEEAASLMERVESKYALFIDMVFSREQQYIWTGDTFEKNKYWVVDFFGGDVSRVSPRHNVFVRPVRPLK